ncbi:glycosyltransferase family 4 protein [Patescibacteria group bacterium]|nr:glycosyltransferase family 4 protein [Patescibacteria group bacterium]MCL5010582.1 glycosyltransferase family 4 protein [Patescibacteria group bacterium]
MKKILVITPFFYPHIGGSERYMEDLYAFLKERHPEVSVDVLCYNTDQVKEREKYRGLNIYRISCYTILPGQFCLPRPFSLFKFLIKHNSYHLIHCSTRFFDSSWWAVFFAFLIRARIVLTDHCANHPATSSRFINTAVKVIEASLVKISLPFYSEIFAENRKTQRFLRKAFGVKSKLAYPGLDYFTDRKSKASHGKKKRLKIAYVGRIIESKGVNLLFEIAGEIPGADFVFAGEGELAKKLKRQAARFKMNNISVLGGIPKSEVLELLRSSDIFAYPSWHSEGLPLALIEAGAMGLPVLATDSGAINELIKDGQTGILVKKSDPRAFRRGLERLLDDSNLREKLGGNLRRFILKNFSWENAASFILRNLK